MAYYNDGKVFRNLPEQVEKNKDDIETIQTAQKTDESNINTNLNNINAHETRLNALESLKMTQDGQNIKLTKSTGEIGNIAVGTVGGTNLLGGNNVTFKTINGENITGNGNLTVDANLSNLLWASLGIGRWAGSCFFDYNANPKSMLDDPLLPYYTNLTRFMSRSEWIYRNDNTKLRANVAFAQNFPDTYVDFSYAFYGVDMKSITLPNTKSSSFYFAFAHSTLEKVLVANGCTVYVRGAMGFIFHNCKNLTEIGEFDLSGCTDMGHFITQCSKVKSIHCKHFKISFDISDSTAFEESDLVEILNNLDVVSATKTLTMGATNLAKLTIDDILIATGKGWTLA